ncbi:ATP-binding protein [Streptomyces sp. DH24]|uniref:ATP-binding protein n=1 Tax=Streptomyces sp. DH24 TaxID=3040123 RepID=UPI0024437175|nr:ATP-binding protein [Streptomyces sp. DH24]MDG9717574.1 ATP-binding protein [Streptomyces sp. DH24]
MPAPRTRIPSPVRTFAQRFSATRRGARLARLLAAQQLAEWGHPRGTEAHDTVVLVVAELAANAVLHGRVPGRDFALFLSYDEERGVVRVEVADTHPVRPARGTPGSVPAADADHGRGLLLVDALAARWGVTDRVGPGKTVWAECTTPPPVRRGVRRGGGGNQHDLLTDTRRVPESSAE